MHTLMGTSRKAFRFKASVLTLTTCHLFSSDVALIQEELRPLIEQTPHFFQQLPIILDLNSLTTSPGEIVDFPALIRYLRCCGLIPVGIRGGHAEQQTWAIQAGLAVLSDTKLEKTEVTPPPYPSSSNGTAKLITQPVRSGQQVYAKNSDLIVLATVSPGAELLADGNIHVYGRLKGRALAGVTGNPNTHIFCRSLEAELVAIAGHYWLSEDLHDAQTTPGKAGTHIFLQEERLQLTALN